MVQMKDKWVVDVKTVPYFKGIKFEVSVVRENNKYGIASWGWRGEDKLILFSSMHCVSRRIEAYKRLATVVCDALNTASLDLPKKGGN